MNLQVGGVAMDRGKVLQKTNPLLIAMEQKNMPYFREVSQCVSVALYSTLPDIKISLPFGYPSLETLSSLEGQEWCVHRLPEYSLEVGKV